MGERRRGPRQRQRRRRRQRARERWRQPLRLPRGAGTLPARSFFSHGACWFLVVSVHPAPSLPVSGRGVSEWQADWKKLRVKELRKICDDEGIDSKGFTEKEEFLKAIKAHFNIKDEV